MQQTLRCSRFEVLSCEVQRNHSLSGVMVHNLRKKRPVSYVEKNLFVLLRRHKNVMTSSIQWKLLRDDENKRYVWIFDHNQHFCIIFW